ncbi:MAG: hypothetical protein Q4G60_12795 [bacterium]|nr:hypothetical protein [bacterium]
MKQTNETNTAGKLNIIVQIFKKLRDYREKINRQMEKRYSPKFIASWTTGLAAVLLCLMLFVPNYLGVADDGSLSKVMRAAGLNYIQSDIDHIYNNYFVRTYSNVLTDFQKGDNSVSTHILVVKAAVWLDNLCTGDKYFDIRFLSLLYSIMYIPALWLFMKQACCMVKKFSEGVVIGVFGLLIFADVSYLTYFNSFYPEALWYVCILYCVGAALAFQRQNKLSRDILYFLILVLSALLLIFSKQQCAIAGILIAVFVLKLIFVRKHWLWNVLCIMTALFLTFTSLTSMVRLDSDFDQRSKYHAMTRGVLFQSDDPAATLSEFGIDSSYEMLTDTSSYDYLPFVKAENADVLQKEFYDQYTISDISMYYVRHPGKLFSMLDVATRAAFSIRRSYCGNYEESVGLPAQARSLFWSGWSTFKENSAPKTIGYIVILVIGIIMLYGRSYSLRPSENRRSTVVLDTLIMVLFICLSQAIISIVNSGDAELTQHCFLMGCGIDMMSYFVLVEILHKLNIL